MTDESHFPFQRFVSSAIVTGASNQLTPFPEMLLFTTFGLFQDHIFRVPQ